MLGGKHGGKPTTHKVCTHACLQGPTPSPTLGPAHADAVGVQHSHAAPRLHLRLGLCVPPGMCPLSAHVLFV